MVLRQTLNDYWTLCKPRVVGLMLLTVVVGMYLAPVKSIPLYLIVTSLIGIGLCASSAAAVNHILDRRIDAIMQRTQNRPVATARVSMQQALVFAGILGLAGVLILLVFTNKLTALLTFLTIIGYAGVYTGYLKRATPQNIVIGGLAGATPPLLGWTAVTNHLAPEAWLLVLIIFTWTPAHFWALAIYRLEEYRSAHIPMLPVTHGVSYTTLNILLYTILLVIVSILPYLIGMSGVLYLGVTIILDIRFVYWAIKLHFKPEPRYAMQTFRYSIIYLMGVFICLLIDHYLPGL